MSIRCVSSYPTLKELELRDNYSSDDSNILADLFRPCLSCSNTYFRSVGYMDGKVFAILADEFERFAMHGGEARLLIGRTVSPEDYLAIKEGKEHPGRFLTIPDIAKLWESVESDLKKRGLLVLSWLTARGTVQVRFSIRAQGIHHDKFALFRDRDQNEVIAHGTNNETAAAGLPEFNYESLSIWKSWEAEGFKKHGEYKLQEFLRLWEGKSKSAISVEAPDPVLDQIASLSEAQRSTPEFLDLFSRLEEALRSHEDLPRIPIFWEQNRYQLFDHQRKAINAFFQNDYRGIFALATGSGKTITALHAATLLARDVALNNDVNVFVIITVPYQVLADQWINNLRNFAYKPIRAYGSIQNWYDTFDAAVTESLFSPSPKVVSIVAVNRTFQSDAFQGLCHQIAPEQIVFIGDECHRLGAILSNEKGINASYRMGLSATPWAPSEETLRSQLTDYFDRPIAYYGLSHAFDDEVLVGYSYFVKDVSLSEQEANEYEAHTIEIKKLQAIKLNGGNINEDTLNYHFNARAAVLGSAEQKFTTLPKVLDEVSQRVGLRHLLVYCGTGSTDEDNSATGSVRDIERAQHVASSSVGLQSARITAAEAAPVRQNILRAFEVGSIHAVFAIKVLDEGFDMPGIKSAILLASSRNERQFIQRRGRVLRKADGKEQAYIWDFIISASFEDPVYEKELAQQELLRTIEFARLSNNWLELEARLREHAARHDLDFDQLYRVVEESRYEVEPSE